MDDLTKGVIWAFVGFLAKEIYDWIKSRLEKSTEKDRKELDEFIREVKAFIGEFHDLKEVIGMVTLKLEFFKEALDKIPKLEKDLNEAHAKIRETRAQLGHSNGR